MEVKKRSIKLMVVGGTGSGKTTLASSFPKNMIAITEPGSEETFLNNPQLLSNIVDYKHFIPTSEEDTQKVFKELYEYTALARDKAIKGEIETFTLDNFSYLMENRWIYINKFEKLYSSKTGEVDTRGMYGVLGRWAYGFVMMNLLSIPANVIVTVHERMETDEALEKKPDKSSPIVPSVLGGFRDDMAGLFSGVFYLLKISEANNKYRYMARVNAGGGRLAKNRWNLPPIIESISYTTIIEAINKNALKA